MLDDGGEVDLDLGNYERFLDCTLHRDNNITTGKIYQSVIAKERKGLYLGKTVQVVPHVTDEIQRWVSEIALKPTDGSSEAPEVCVIELGGTVGDIESMPFVEAFRQFKHVVGAEKILFGHVSLVPPTTDGEQKTKPTQHTIRDLRGLGLTADVIFCRSQRELDADVRSKISRFCDVAASQVFSVFDCDSIYHVPLLLQQQGLLGIFNKKIGLDFGDDSLLTEDGLPMQLSPWASMADRYANLTKPVKIALVGKYTKKGIVMDAYSSVIKALRHSCLLAGYKLDLSLVSSEDIEPSMLEKEPKRYHSAWSGLCHAEGIIVPGGFGDRGIEGKIAAVNWARTRGVPYLGVCLGLQMAVIEFARNVLGLEGANSMEINPATEHKVVVEMLEHTSGGMGGTQRLGKRRTVFVDPDCTTKKLYFDEDHVEERHRHRYEVNPEHIEQFEAKGMKFVGRDIEGERMEILELEGHPYFVATQFHPEYLSRPMSPAPVFNGFILAACGKLGRWLAKRPSKDEVFTKVARTESAEAQMTADGVGFRPSRPSWMVPDSPPPTPKSPQRTSIGNLGSGAATSPPAMAGLSVI